MADKGFNIDELLRERGVTLNIPPFMKDGSLSEDDVVLTRSIASLYAYMSSVLSNE